MYAEGGGGGEQNCLPGFSPNIFISHCKHLIKKKKKKRGGGIGIHVLPLMSYEEN